ncbi:MAG: hypothetical protein C4330_11400 [Chitinophagaceae bacterium]
MSSVGANAKSKNFYLRLKGSVEETIQKTSIPSISIFRPFILLGCREESRPGEKIGQVLMNTFSFLLPSHYKPIQASSVASAMIAASKKQKPGFHIYQYKEMKAQL